MVQTKIFTTIDGIFFRNLYDNKHMNIFVTATDTDVGKTFVTTGIAAVMQSLGYSMSVYKPIQSGAINKNGILIPPDIAFVKQIDPFIKTHCTYLFEQAVSPALAAFLEGKKIDKNMILSDFNKLRNTSDIVITEGAGGILAPVYNDFLIADLISFLKLPVIIVARPDLGTVNHTLLTINEARARNIEVLGVIINKYPLNTNDVAVKTAPQVISDLGKVEILGVIPDINTYSMNFCADTLLDIMINNVNFEKTFKMAIPKLSLID